ncbi:MAG TPA: molybdenum cofactor guanylyltransferase [Dehalococcoidia bacterium]|nr:molybdenum cofactor guanylyltransferase [Dehalococcoidia bacterium]
MEPLDGIVLAGGQSRRLGIDKALLSLGGAPLLQTVVQRVSQVCPRVIVAVDRPGRYRRLGLAARFVADASPGLGPLAGLQSGLRACSTEYAFVVACDLPFLNVELLRYMAGLPRSYQALLPRSAGRDHPLHAVYARSCLPEVDALLAAGGGSMKHLLDRLDVRRLDDRDLRRIDPDGLSLLNLNEEPDLERARSLWERQATPG